MAYKRMTEEEFQAEVALIEKRIRKELFPDEETPKPQSPQEKTFAEKVKKKISNVNSTLPLFYDFSKHSFLGKSVDALKELVSVKEFYEKDEELSEKLPLFENESAIVVEKLKNDASLVFRATEDEGQGAIIARIVKKDDNLVVDYFDNTFRGTKIAKTQLALLDFFKNNLKMEENSIISLKNYEPPKGKMRAIFPARYLTATLFSDDNWKRRDKDDAIKIIKNFIKGEGNNAEIAIEDKNEKNCYRFKRDKRTGEISLQDDNFETIPLQISLDNKGNPYISHTSLSTFIGSETINKLTSYITEALPLIKTKPTLQQKTLAETIAYVLNEKKNTISNLADKNFNKDDLSQTPEMILEKMNLFLKDKARGYYTGSISSYLGLNDIDLEQIYDDALHTQNINRLTERALPMEFANNNDILKYATDKADLYIFETALSMKYTNPTQLDKQMSLYSARFDFQKEPLAIVENIEEELKKLQALEVVIYDTPVEAEIRERRKDYLTNDITGLIDKIANLTIDDVREMYHKNYKAINQVTSDIVPTIDDNLLDVALTKIKLATLMAIKKANFPYAETEKLYAEKNGDLKKWADQNKERTEKAKAEEDKKTSWGKRFLKSVGSLLERGVHKMVGITELTQATDNLRTSMYNYKINVSEVLWGLKNSPDADFDFGQELERLEAFKSASLAAIKDLQQKAHETLGGNLYEKSIKELKKEVAKPILVAQLEDKIQASDFFTRELANSVELKTQREVYNAILDFDTKKINSIYESIKERLIERADKIRKNEEQEISGLKI